MKNRKMRRDMVTDWSLLSSSVKKNRICRVLKMDCIAYWKVCNKVRQRYYFRLARAKTTDLDNLRLKVYFSYEEGLKSSDIGEKDKKISILKNWLGLDKEGVIING